MLDTLHILRVLIRQGWDDMFGGLRGWLIWAAALLANGVIFNVFVLGGRARFSEDVLRDGFAGLFVTTCVLCPLWCMRSVAHERAQGTWALWAQSPWSSATIALGKWVGGLVPMMIWFALSLVIPAMILLNGRVSWAHVVAGYAGLVLCAGMVSALSVLASALARAPWVAALMAYAVVAALAGTSALARVTQGLSASALEHMGLFETHFVPFARGQIPTQSVLYFAVLTGLFGALSALRIDLIRGARS